MEKWKQNKQKIIHHVCFAFSCFVNSPLSCEAMNELSQGRREKQREITDMGIQVLTLPDMIRNLFRRIFLNFAKSCTLSCLLQFSNKSKAPVSQIMYESFFVPQYQNESLWKLSLNL